MLALIEGITFDHLCRLYTIMPRGLRTWMIRSFNERGIDGLIERKSPGAPRKISQEECAQYRQLLEQPELAGQTHWTARKFHGYVRQEHQCEAAYFTLIRLIHEMGFCLKVAQPWPDRQDEVLREAFRGRMRQWVCDEQTNLWFMDEMGVESDPRLRRRWASKGSKPRVTKKGDHLRMNVTGMVCPNRPRTNAVKPMAIGPHPHNIPIPFSKLALLKK